MRPLFVHSLFDALAWATALGCLVLMRRTWFPENPVGQPLRLGYLAALVFGAGIGAWGLGTANLYASDVHEAGRSIAGALAGAIAAIEIYKKANGIRARTGAAYALPVASGIAIGRIGCLLSGLDDQTYGIPTGTNWGWDFGDSITRHPVQLYESLAMATFALVYILMVRRGSQWWKVNGFYLAVGYYGAQRFVLEFLKPYHSVFAGLTVFQLLSVIMIAYSAVMIATAPSVRKVTA